jgi:hypothetical protein
MSYLETLQAKLLIGKPRIRLALKPTLETTRPSMDKTRKYSLTPLISELERPNLAAAKSRKVKGLRADHKVATKIKLQTIFDGEEFDSASSKGQMHTQISTGP